MQQPDTDSQAPVPTTTTTAPLTDDSHFTSALKDWVEVDNKISYYNQHLKECRQVRNQLTPSICNYMERQSLQNTKIQISDGSLHYASESTTPSFSQKFLLDGLTAFFDGRMGAGNNGGMMANECLEFLRSRRVPETKTVLKRKYANASS
jgi:hypothetical protein